MLNVIPGRSFHGNGTMPQAVTYAPYGSIKQLLINGVWQPEKPPSILPGAFANVAAAGNLNVYTVTAAKIPVIYSVTLSASVAGRYTFQYVGIAWDFLLGANVPIVIPFPTPVVMAAGANIFIVTNNAGGASNIGCVMTLQEY